MKPEEINNIDFSKMFMAIAVAIVFIMQQWHTMELSNLKSDTLHRDHIEQTYMTREDIELSGDLLHQRINELTRQLEEMKNGK